MTSDSRYLIKRIRHLSIALIVSATLNIAVLALLLFWIVRERPPTPYCELKPASYEQKHISLTEQRECNEQLNQLSRLSFSQLIDRLSNAQQLENGCEERELALACLVSLHFFDIHRALSKEIHPLQPRLLTWSPKGSEHPIALILYSNLTQQQYLAIERFARTERWPLTTEGLFCKLKEYKGKSFSDNHLEETFTLTSEFWTVELLFSRSGSNIGKHDIVSILLEGEWTDFKKFVEQQRRLQDTSELRKQKFLLDYANLGSTIAAKILAKTNNNHLEMGINRLAQASVDSTSPPIERPKIAGKIEKKIVKNEDKISVRGVKTPKSEPLEVLKTNSSSSQKWEGGRLPQIIFYTVQDGDNLWKIANRFGVKVDEIKKINQLNSDVLKKGSTLSIPSNTSANTISRK